jgi:hypothetical protein
MRRVKLRHPETGGEFEARESAVDVYRKSGWEVVTDDRPTSPPAPVLDPLPDPEPSGEPFDKGGELPSAAAEEAVTEPEPVLTEDQAKQSPRGRRTKKESE